MGSVFGAYDSTKPPIIPERPKDRPMTEEELEERVEAIKKYKQYMDEWFDAMMKDMV